MSKQTSRKTKINLDRNNMKQLPLPQKTMPMPKTLTFEPPNKLKNFPFFLPKKLLYSYTHFFLDVNFVFPTFCKPMTFSPRNRRLRVDCCGNFQEKPYSFHWTRDASLSFKTLMEASTRAPLASVLVFFFFVFWGRLKPRWGGK